MFLEYIGYISIYLPKWYGTILVFFYENFSNIILYQLTKFQYQTLFTSQSSVLHLVGRMRSRVSCVVLCHCTIAPCGYFVGPNFFLAWHDGIRPTVAQESRNLAHSSQRHYTIWFSTLVQKHDDVMDFRI